MGLSVDQATLSRMMGLLVNNELRRICKELDMTWFDVLACYFPG